jgi:hypothetical protein
VSDRPWQRYRSLPLWGRWLITIVVYGVAVAAVVIVVRGGVSGGGGVTTQSEAKAEAEANHEAQIVVEEDQAPHVAAWRSHTPVPMALKHAITGDVNTRIATQQLTGPLQSVHCAPSGAASAGRMPYRCTVTTAGIAYPFLAIADKQSGQLTWCKVDPPPSFGGSTSIPISSRCKP